MLKRHHGLQDELDDLKILLACIVLVPLTWMVALNWQPGLLNSRYDNIQQALPYLRQLFERGGDWRETLYRAEWLGGSRLASVAGMAPIYWFAAKLGFSVITAINLAGFFVQVLYAFFGVRTVLGILILTGQPRDTRQPTFWLWLTGTVWLTAFVPMLGWRFGFGDILGLLGGLIFPGFLALFTAALSRRLTLTQVLVALVAFLNGFPSLGQQHILNGAVFGLPILVGIAGLAPRNTLKALAVPSLVLLGALGMSAPGYFEMWSYAASTDAARPLSGDTVLTYSHLVATGRDWLSSLPWTTNWLNSGRPFHLGHEMNYPLGPVLLLLAFFPFRRARPLVIGVGLSALLAILFSMGAEPVATALLSVVPALKHFREPQRAFRPAYYSLYLIAIVGVSARFSGSRIVPTNRREWLTFPKIYLAILLVPLLWFIWPDVREAFTWLSLATLVGWSFFRRDDNRVSAGLVLLLLGAASVSAFHERLPPYFIDDEELIIFPGEESLRLVTSQPELKSPLTRMVLHKKMFSFDINTAQAFGISTLEGYWHAPRRFGELYMALQGRAYDPTYLVFSMEQYPDALLTLGQLYNVGYTLEVRARNLSASLAPGAGEAWFSSALATVDSFPVLASKLRQAGTKLAETIHREIWVISPDVDVDVRKAQLPNRFDPACSKAVVKNVDARLGEQNVQLQLSVPPTTTPCPLTIAMNFETNLVARILKPSKPEAEGTVLTVFPGYGALTSILVPAGEHSILIGAEPADSPWLRVATAVGSLLIVGAVLMVYMRKTTSTVNS